MGVTCPSTTTCYAVGTDSSGNGLFASTTDGGTTWRTGSLGTLNGSQAIACPSTTTCYAVGQGVEKTTDGGTSWSFEPVLSNVSELNDVACPSTTTCYAVGQSSGGVNHLNRGPNASSSAGTSGNDASGVVDFTTDGGAGWTMGQLPSGIAGLNGIACPSTTTCYAVGEEGSSTGVVVASADGGRTWTQQALPSQVLALYGIRCPSATTCYAVGATSSQSGVAVSTTNGGSTAWREQTVPSEVSILSGVACPSKVTCSAVGYNGNSRSGAAVSTADGGSTWRAETVPSGVLVLNGVACASKEACFAVGQSSGSDGIILNRIVPTPPVTITTTSLPRAIEGRAYAASLAATGGTTPYTWAVASGSLPAGLSLDPSRGTITGTPTAAGTSTFTVQVTDSTSPDHQTNTKDLTLTVHKALPTRTILQASPRPGKADQPVAFTAIVRTSQGPAEGQITFAVDDRTVTLCSAVRLDNQRPDEASCTLRLAQGIYRATAKYHGGDGFEPSVSRVLREKVQA